MLIFLKKIMAPIVLLFYYLLFYYYYSYNKTHKNIFELNINFLKKSVIYQATL